MLTHSFKIHSKYYNMLVQYQFPFAPVEQPKKKNTAILAIIFLTITGICVYNYLKLKNDFRNVPEE